MHNLAISLIVFFMGQCRVLSYGITLYAYLHFLIRCKAKYFCYNKSNKKTVNIPGSETFYLIK